MGTCHGMYPLIWATAYTFWWLPASCTWGQRNMREFHSKSNVLRFQGRGGTASTCWSRVRSPAAFTCWSHRAPTVWCRPGVSRAEPREAGPSSRGGWMAPSTSSAPGSSTRWAGFSGVMVRSKHQRKYGWRGLSSSHDATNVVWWSVNAH